MPSSPSPPARFEAWGLSLPRPKWTKISLTGAEIVHVPLDFYLEKFSIFLGSWI